MDSGAAANGGYWSAALRRVATYFNTRYQRYGRHVHIWAHFNDGTDTPEARRADAARNRADLHPFAVVSYPQYDTQDYLSAMAQHGAVALVGSKLENSGSIGAPGAPPPGDHTCVKRRDAGVVGPAGPGSRVRRATGLLADGPGPARATSTAGPPASCPR